MEGGERSEQAVHVTQTVSLIRNVEHALWRNEPAPVETQRIKWPVAVVRAEENQLRLREARAIAIRVYGCDERATVIRVDASRQVDALIVLNLFRESPERVLLQADLLRQVQHVDDHRCDACDARVRGCGQPRRPAALRCARDREAFQGEIPL